MTDDLFTKVTKNLTEIDNAYTELKDKNEKIENLTKDDAALIKAQMYFNSLKQSGVTIPTLQQNMENHTFREEYWDSIAREFPDKKIQIKINKKTEEVEVLFLNELITFDPSEFDVKIYDLKLHREAISEAMQECIICSEDTKMKCGRCLMAYYCCVDHQKKDIQRHKKVCKKKEKNIDSNGNNENGNESDNKEPKTNLDKKDDINNSV
jgi:hypothetical protein